MTSSLVAQSQLGYVALAVKDTSNKLLPCRVHLKDSSGKPQRADSLPFWHDHFVCPGTAQFQLAPGKYSYEIERGPEYQPLSGSFEVQENLTNTIGLKLERLADMAAEGWWSGDLHVHRSINDIELLMQAEDLHVAPVMTWWNNQNYWQNQKTPERLLVKFDGNRFYHLMGGEDEREGGALLYFNLEKPLRISGATREYPSPMQFLHEARHEKGVWIDIEKPFWWDVPVWLASGQVDSIELANNHMCRSQMYESEAWGKPRDSSRLPPPRGNGFWSQEIYYHILNCGLRLPPSAGSASGVLPNPVGYNRVYVYTGKDLSYDKWWQGLRAGRSFVSNGPLLRCKANGQLPGHVFTLKKQENLSVDLQIGLSTREPVSYIEVIKDGEIAETIGFEEWKRTGKTGILSFNRSGWFLVRVIAENPKTFRFASTAPYYVEVGEAKRRISRSAAQFFLDWVRERKERVNLDNVSQRSEVMKHHDSAERFWAEMVTNANSD